ncbi:MAG: hypothetical protein A2Y66_08390 [Nitrospirae bacterium RBG_13_41_22]|nr:MAG: hypothetical protein A2Y66_08390 [Nitrospirae bacterium RBG_13_41_22]OHE57294.1 MAG: hypothetical protein A2Z47_12875 [Thermodesulfovibrio sp. RBG_19FT_COMBO_42_12]
MLTGYLSIRKPSPGQPKRNSTDEEGKGIFPCLLFFKFGVEGVVDVETLFTNIKEEVKVGMAL